MSCCTLRFEFCAAHRVWRSDDSAAAQLHGHNWAVEITFRRSPRECKGALDSANGVLPPYLVKRAIITWFAAHWNHALLLNEKDPLLLSGVLTDAKFVAALDLGEKKQQRVYPVVGNPTAEVLATLLGTDIVPRLLHGLVGAQHIEVRRVIVWESRTLCATWTKEERAS